MGTKVITEHEGKTWEVKYFYFNLTKENLAELNKAMQNKDKMLSYVDFEKEKVVFGQIVEIKKD